MEMNVCFAEPKYPIITQLPANGEGMQHLHQQTFRFAAKYAFEITVHKEKGMTNISIAL